MHFDSQVNGRTKEKCAKDKRKDLARVRMNIPFVNNELTHIYIGECKLAIWVSVSSFEPNIILHD